MSLIPCPECGQQVSDKAPACPRCGYPSPSADDVVDSPVAAVSADESEHYAPVLAVGDTIRLSGTRPKPYHHGTTHMKWEHEDDSLLGRSGHITEIDGDGTFRLDVDPRGGWFAPSWIDTGDRPAPEEHFWFELEEEGCPATATDGVLPAENSGPPLLSKAAYCSACAGYIWLNPDGCCFDGHARSSLRGLYDAQQDPASGKPLAPGVRAAPTVQQAAGVLGAGAAPLAVAAADRARKVAANLAVTAGDGMQRLAVRIAARPEGSPSSESPVTPAHESIVSTLQPQPRVPFRIGWGQRERMWRPAPALTTAIAFWLVTIGVGGAFERGGWGGGTQSGFVILCMLVVVIACVATTWRPWRIWQRMLLVVAAWFAQGFALMVAYPVSMVLAGATGRAGALDRVGALLAALPVMAFAMRQSRLFTRAREGERDHP
jgi:hypothetical protein